MYINLIRGCHGIYYIFMYVVVGFTFMYKMYAICIQCKMQQTAY